MRVDVTVFVLNDVGGVEEMGGREGKREKGRKVEDNKHAR